MDVPGCNMLKKFRFGGIAENPKIYLDENVLRMTVNIRGNFGRLALELLKKGEKEKAAETKPAPAPKKKEGDEFKEKPAQW